MFQLQIQLFQEIILFHIYGCKFNISAATILCQIVAEHEKIELMLKKFQP